MGNDFCTCTCLNDLTTPESENLSRGLDRSTTGNKINNNPKIILNKNNTIDSTDHFFSLKEKESKSTTISSNYKNNSIVSLRNSNHKQKKKEKIKFINLKNNLNTKNDKNVKKNPRHPTSNSKEKNKQIPSSCNTPSNKTILKPNVLTPSSNLQFNYGNLLNIKIIKK